jgi:hypothetical protein
MNTRHFILHVSVDIWRSFLYIYGALKSQNSDYLSTKSFILSVRRYMPKHVITPGFYAKYVALPFSYSYIIVCGMCKVL